VRIASQRWGYGGRGDGDMIIILKGGGHQETHLARPSHHLAPPSRHKIASHESRLCKLTKLIFGTGHKHKFYVYARKHRFMFTCINTKLILGLLQ
jgi:hypothetical protein